MSTLAQQEEDIEEYVDPELESICFHCESVIVRDSTEDTWNDTEQLMFPEICTESKESPFNHISVLDI